MADFDDGFRGAAVKRDTLDNTLDFARFTVALARGDAAGEDDVFEVEDGEVVIVKFIRSRQALAEKPWWERLAGRSA